MSKHPERQKDMVKRQTVIVKPSSYQPSVAELEADMSIDATPEEIARSVMRDVTIKPQ